MGSPPRLEPDAMTQVCDARDLYVECREIADRAKVASRALAVARGSAKDGWLKRAADSIRRRADEILLANLRDVEAAPAFGLSAAAIDRLTLNPKRLEDVSQA